MLASLGLGAPLVGKEARLEFAVVQRQTDLSERIRAPHYPFAIDKEMAGRGAEHYQARCASCHAGPEGPNRLHEPSEIGTDPTRIVSFTQKQADNFNKFLGSIETPGYHAPTEPGIRSTRKVWAASLPGVWARSPYLHNGSVRTMQELLTPPTQRAKSFHRGSREYSESEMGYTDSGSFVLDTTQPGNSNAGHDYGTDLTASQKRELIEYLKTL
jgi:mono/diheme cytochrome c family protein